MPDTGAPWNIPYAEPSDLVRDWPDLSEDVADAVALGLTAAGAVKQVKAATDSTLRTTTSNSYVDADISLSFTPTAATSLLVVSWSGILGAARNSTDVATRLAFVRLVEVGGSALSGAEDSFAGRDLVATSGVSADSYHPLLLQGFVSASTTSARTYRLEFRVPSTAITATLWNSSSTGRLSVIEYAAGVL